MDQGPTISPRGRLLLAAIVLAAVGALATARWLAPDRRGYGTHEQLGWAPCWFQTWTGRRCPTCGMTTAWAYAVRGQVLSALSASAGGAAACGTTLLVTPWLLASSVAGRWMIARPSPKVVLWFGSALMMVLLLDWVRRIVAN